MALTPAEVKAKKIEKKRNQIAKKVALITKYEYKRTSEQAKQAGYVLALQTETNPKLVASLTKKNVKSSEKILKYNQAIARLENEKLALEQEIAALIGTDS
jgi:hypothetical protein